MLQMDRKLLDYLPYEIRKYKDYQVITEAEDPEFKKLFDISKKLLDETFIETATDYGLSRLEKMLGVYPKSYDTLDDRRLRLIAWWNNQVPYTWRVLIEKLNAICGVGNYDIKLYNETYTIDLKTQLNTSSQYEEMMFLFDRIIPANIVMLSSNTLSHKYEKDLYYGVVLTETKEINITNDIDEVYMNFDNLIFGNAISEYKNVLVSNDLVENYLVNRPCTFGSIISEYKAIQIKTKELI